MRKTTGISLILLIFLSLCLITFSLLSLSGAAADERLSQKAADRTTEYYTAVSAANEVLAEIDAKLAEYLKITAAYSSKTYWQKLCSQLPEEIDGLSHQTLIGTICFQNDNLLSFDITVTETQQLHVVLELHDPEAASNTMYHITEWKVINTQEWNADQSQNLLRTDSMLPVQE